MKLAVTIPAYNEEKNLPKVIREIPREIEGIEKVQIVVINDGSTDRTAEVAEKAGADKIITFRKNRGLANAFRVGLSTALELGADIIVNTDADFQYDGTEIPKLIKPIIDGKADIVLGNRQVKGLDHMPIQKKLGNRIATWVTSLMVPIPIGDAQTGFRAFSRMATLRLNIIADYTYVQETIIQATYKGLNIVEVPVRFRKREGKSRLISNIFSYASKAGMAIISTYLFYRPLRALVYLSFTFLFFGLLFGLRVLNHFFQTGKVSPLIPSALFSTLLILIGIIFLSMGVLAKIMETNRKLLEELIYINKKKIYHDIKEKEK